MHENVWYKRDKQDENGPYRPLGTV
jgi:hypothetical protein